mmetsp:Transcript_40890/g.98604  ORF Transcript_40890/g.98604 Transcript_40890/m.98604 type:complete len:247 (-) Transcript_40890:456-1196(-)
MMDLHHHRQREGYDLSVLEVSVVPSSRRINLMQKNLSFPLDASQQQQQQQPVQEPEKSKRGVSFNPQVLVIQPVYHLDAKEEEQNKKRNQFSNNNRFAKSQTWYTDQDIDTFQKNAFFTIKRFQRNWNIGQDDCLRGLEAQTTKCTATKVRINVYKDLVLAKKDMPKRMIAKSPTKTKQIVGVILKASEQDALELAKKDALDALLYQQEPDEDNDNQGFKCFFWDLPKWMTSNNKGPAIVPADLPV